MIFLRWVDFLLQVYKIGRIDAVDIIKIKVGRNKQVGSYIFRKGKGFAAVKATDDIQHLGTVVVSAVNW